MTQTETKTQTMESSKTDPFLQDTPFDNVPLQGRILLPILIIADRPLTLIVRDSGPDYPIRYFKSLDDSALLQATTFMNRTMIRAVGYLKINESFQWEVIAKYFYARNARDYIEVQACRLIPMSNMAELFSIDMPLELREAILALALKEI